MVAAVFGSDAAILGLSEGLDELNKIVPSFC
jgi:hypothetical protein